ncbi:hypothetical protein LPW11_01845 [Geomonas sp. RF6]|uniref:hypothetical protein n=1 Tax=Geomonas sp. RF6 TaxID=2897342 RepID=UPI001E37BAD9|nr:hypothetical protein [Geomonas sp. RF6]UFS70939.1 hypothetical protein LPW11_01845 [Geomonas sp. RF6]
MPVTNTFFAMMLLLSLSVTAAHGDPSGSTGGSSASEDVKVVGGVRELLSEREAIATGAGAQHSDVAPSWDPCLKEGETCNTLNDRCCHGYYCFGGLVPTCVRKP